MKGSAEMNAACQPRSLFSRGWGGAETLVYRSRSGRRFSKEALFYVSSPLLSGEAALNGR